MLEESKVKKIHFNQNTKIITSIKKDLSQTHVARNFIKDPTKRISLKDGIPISKTKISFMGSQS